jgi:hypothetical protein
MKIISKFKDYYDYLMGIYGSDEKLVYDRRFDHLITVDSLNYEGTDKKPGTLRISVCNKKYDFYYYQGVWYHTPGEIAKMNVIYSEANGLNDKYSRYRSAYNSEADSFYDEKVRWTDVNTKSRQPILISGSMLNPMGKSQIYYKDKNVSYGIPILKEFPLPKYLPAEEIYNSMSLFLGWLNDNPEIPNTQNDKEKILSHGFDLKNSFRPNKKN